MCGICGKIYFDRSRPVERPLLEAMTRVLQHRGPDDSGVYVQGPVGLGHQRLSIIDLSPAGHQPMSNEDGTLWLVYNGEIYNFEELRKELAAKGHAFRSHTDTEVIIHLYEEEGRDCVRKLRGMFAFALWDSRKQELLLARDRAGKKPLVYAVVDGALIFASEIKSLLQDPSVCAEVNPEALHHYLTYQYVPGPLTIFRCIQKLPPAHTLVLHEGACSLQRYWTVSYAAGQKLPTDTDYIAAFSEVFRDAVRVRLRSDVPLGAFLSGGIDSSAIVAVMSGLLTQPVKTFSIGFEEAEYNELPYARMVARQYNTEHTEFTVKPDALSILPTLVRQYDEPFADPSAIPTYYVAQLTRQHVTVALNGDGGDESFAGYERYVAHRLADWYAKVPRLLREGIIKSAVNLFPYREYRWSISRRLQRFINGIAEEPARRYVNWLCYFSNRMKEQLYSPGFMESVRGVDSIDITAAVYRQADTDNLLEQTLYTDVNLYLPYDLLVKADIACMAHSLEARSPFLDHRLMEFAAALPPGLKLHGLQKKHILKKAFAKMLPREILFRRKMGFGVPLDRWFRQELKQAAYDVLLDPRAVARGYFRPEEVRRLLDEHAGLQADHSFRIWALFWLELWHRMFVDKSQVLGI